MREAGKGVDIYIFDNGIDWHEIYQKHGYLRTLRGDKDYTDGGPVRMNTHAGQRYEADRNAVG
jgi:hypothetical protein